MVLGISYVKFRRQRYFWKKPVTGFAGFVTFPYSHHVTINYSPNAPRCRVINTGSHPIERAKRYFEIDLKRFQPEDTDTQESDLEGTELSHTQSE